MPKKPPNNQTEPTDNQKALERFQQIQDLYNQGLAEGKTPHDVLFKLMMERPDVAKVYLEVELPTSLSRRVDWDSLQYQPTNFSEPTISEKRSDLLLSLELRPRKNHTDTETIYVYCMFEHQSTDDHTMAWRFFEYLYLWYSHYIKSISDSKFPKKLPFIFPLVLYNGVTPWKSPVSFQELVNIPRGCKSFVPHFEFSLKDLSQIDDPDIQSTYHRSFLLTKFLEYFKYSRRPEFYDRLLLDTEFVQLRDQRGDVLYAIFVYILQTQPNHQKVIKMLNNKLRQEENMVDVIALIKEVGREEGREEGIEQGIKRGRQEGRQEGEYQAKLATAQNLLEMGLSIEQIAKATGLNEKDIRNLSSHK